MFFVVFLCECNQSLVLFHLLNMVLRSLTPTGSEAVKWLSECQRICPVHTNDEAVAIGKQITTLTGVGTLSQERWLLSELLCRGVLLF